MCLTLQPSRMSGTILYAAETTHNDRLLHVMGYQNKATNLASGPNAMILPIPSASPMGPENAIDMTSCKNVLKDYEKTLVAMNQTRSRGMKSLGVDSLSFSKAVQVFDTGSYTVVLARDASYINTALSQVPEKRRPSPNPAIFEAYSKLYPGWHIALCCYDGTIDAEPMVWQYEPLDPSQLFLPALDGHDGKVPNLAASVTRDHTVLVSLVNAPEKARYAMKMRTGSEGKATLPTLSGDEIPETHRYLFGKFFYGTQAHQPTKNGDIAVLIAELANPNFVGHAGNFKIVSPPGA